MRSRKCIARPECEALTLYSDRVSMNNEVHILWSPEKGPCQQCGMTHEYVRKFTAQGSATKFCVNCWNGFVSDECNVTTGEWKNDVSNSWNESMALCLEYEHGTASRTTFLH